MSVGCVTADIAEDNGSNVGNWGAVFALSLCVFVLIASEFMPVSLLTPIASDLSLTEGQAGQAISVSGLFAVLTSLLIASASGRLDRKVVVVGLTALMLISGLVVSLAPNYTVLMIGRALLGIVIGGFWSMSTAIVMRLVPPDAIPKALAILNGGNALAATIAAPMGSFLGGLIGWRGAFFCIVPIAALAICWQMLSLPRMHGGKAARATATFRLLGRLPVAVGMAAILLFFMGQFTLYTYLRPFLETVTRVDVATLSLILLGVGAAGLVGAAFIGKIVGRSPYGTVIVAPILLAITAVGLVLYGHSVIATALLLAFWGLVGTPAPVGWGAWLSRTLPEDAEAGGGLQVAVIQFAITLGAVLGGRLLDASGYTAVFLASAVILVFAALLAYASFVVPTISRD